MKKIYKFIALAIVLLSSYTNTKAQCISSASFGGGVISSTVPGLVGTGSGCTFGGEYSPMTFNVIGVFSFSSSIVTDYITITDNSNNVLAFGLSPLMSISIPSLGVYRYHISATGPPGCTSQSACRTNVVFIPLPPCAGLPTAGAVPVSFSICPNTAAVITSTGSAVATGILYQWQQAATGAGPWSNVTTGFGFTSTSLTTASLSTLTFYRLIVTCTTSALTSTTSVLSVNPNNPTYLCYCNSGLGGSGCGFNFITNVSILTTIFNNTSLCNTNSAGDAYSLFTGAGATATLNQGASYSISVNSNQSNIISLWIDYNQNGIFDAIEHTQVILASTAGTAAVAVFNVPATALLGLTGMRVRTHNTGNANGPTDACSNFWAGETEDYAITINAGVICSGAPGSNTISALQSTICPGFNTSLSLVNSYTSTGLTFQWASATTSLGVYSAIAGASLTGYTTPALFSTIWYRCVITCTAGPTSITVSPIPVNVIATTTNNVPYFESFESISFNNQLPNCSWSASSPTTICQTYTSAPGSFNRIANTGTKFASFQYNGSPAEYFYTNGILLNAGTTYSASIRYITDGLSGWNEIAVLYGASQTPAGLINIASLTSGLTNTTYSTLGGIFTATATGIYYIAIKNIASFPPWYFTFDDVSVVTVPACSGAPASNTVLASLTNVCPSSSVALSLANFYTVGGLTYQWASATSFAGPYTIIPGATLSTYTATSMTVNTWFNCVITCTAGPASTTATPLQITVGGNPCQCLAYCTSSASSINDDEIFNVTIGTLNNTSSCSQTGGFGSLINRYSNYAGTIGAPNLSAGITYPFSVTVGQCSGSSYSGGVTVYMDLNQNGTFTDPGEQVYALPTLTLFTVAGTIISGNISIPSTASLGVTRMRVLAVESFTGTLPCAAYTWGETEDYCINILPPTPCVGAPAANAVVATTTNVCIGGNVTLSLLNTYTVGGLSYQWYSSSTLAGPYVLVPGANLSVFTNTNVTSNIFYQSVITCTSGPASTTATPISITVLAAPIYAPVPFLENFDNTWQNRCDIRNVPVAANWNSFPTTGNASWRRQNDGVSANWTGPTTATVAPLTGAGCANFHTFWAFPGDTGTLDLFVAMPNASPYTVKFWYQNPSGSDSLTVYLSTNGGSSFTKQGAYFTNPTWAQKTITLTGVSSPSCILRFTALSDYSDDLGIDSLKITSSCVSPTITASASNASVCAGGSSTLIVTGLANTYTWSTSSTSTLIIVSPTIATTYTVVGSNGAGCNDTKTISVGISPQPTVVAISSSTNICAGQTATLTASGAGNYTWSPGLQTTSVIVVSPTVVTTYTVLGSNGSCTASAAQSMSVKPSPIIVITPATASICSTGGSATLSASGSSSYSWTPANFAGPSNIPTVVVSPTITTIYSVSSTNSLGCVGTKTVNVTIVNCVGIAKNSAISDNIFVYPNPTSGLVTIIVEKNTGSYIFEVADATGKLVYNTILSKAESLVNIIQLANGLYTYKITLISNKQLIKQGKLIKQ